MISTKQPRFGYLRRGWLLVFRRTLTVVFSLAASVLLLNPVLRRSFSHTNLHARTHTHIYSSSLEPVGSF